MDASTVRAITSGAASIAPMAARAIQLKKEEVENEREIWEHDIFNVSEDTGGYNPLVYMGEVPPNIARRNLPSSHPVREGVTEASCAKHSG